MTAITLRLGCDADRSEILARTEEVFGTEAARRSERLWDWQWHADPRLGSAGYRGIVAEWQGRIIANLATIPAGLHINGEPAEAWWLADVLVHWGLTRRALRAQRREHGRTPVAGEPDLSRGIAAAMLDHPAAGPIQLAKHIADSLRTIGLRIGFVPQAHTGSRHRRVSTRNPLAHRVGEGLARPLAAVIDLALPRIPRPRLCVALLEGPFDERFDALWDRTRAAYPAICLRDRKILTWRYHAHPDRDYHTLALDGDRGVRGYCVWKVFEQDRRRRGKIVDLLTPPDDAEGRHALLAGALDEMRRAGVERAECFVSGAAMEQTLAGLGFTERLPKSGRPQPLLTRYLPVEAGEVYVTQGDGDGG
jgi:hypothetical protein